jgi:hypothetical protein
MVGYHHDTGYQGNEPEMIYEQKSGVKLVTTGKHEGQYRVVVDVYLEREEMDELSLWGAGQLRLHLAPPDVSESS